MSSADTTGRAPGAYWFTASTSFANFAVTLRSGNLGLGSGRCNPSMPINDQTLRPSGVSPEALSVMRIRIIGAAMRD